ncbi:hypothetical protein CS542_09065 [Pedobacter sp. IW39]|nr:hypothetical protein CS542_09065 [Pedobacter sp. IW39]
MHLTAQSVSFYSSLLIFRYGRSSPLSGDIRLFILHNYMQPAALLEKWKKTGNYFRTGSFLSDCFACGRATTKLRNCNICWLPEAVSQPLHNGSDILILDVSGVVNAGPQRLRMTLL